MKRVFILTLLLMLFVLNVNAAETITITYYIGNGTSITGEKEIGTTICEKGKSCTLKTFVDFNEKFPNSAYNWSFAGWGVSQTATDVKYVDKETITSGFNTNVSLYAIGKRTFNFYSGINGEKSGSSIQYWNPYSLQAFSKVKVASPVNINTWTFLGYRATDDASADSIAIGATYAGKEFSAPPNKYTILDYRAKYSRVLTLDYNGNGGNGNVESQIKTQYYTSLVNKKGKTSKIYWKLAENSFTKNGFDFNGWSENNSDYAGRGPGLDYGLFSPLVDDSVISRTMYAIWQNHSSTRLSKNSSYGSYSEAQKIIKEVMKGYFLKSELIQYNSAKKTYGFDNPEEATSQEMLYKTCTGFTYSSYVEAFGVNQSIDNFPRASFDIIQVARDYYNNNKNTNNLDGNYLLYYENTISGSKAKYVYNATDVNSVTVEQLAEILQPGDILVYTGHGLMVYDILTKKDGTKDILILNSTTGATMVTREFTSTSKQFFAKSQTGLTTNTSGSNLDYFGNFIIDRTQKYDGTVKPLWMGKDSAFFKNGYLSCAKDECAIIRPFYKTGSDGIVFNYSIDTKAYEKSKTRIDFPGLYIEKTVDKHDNNRVYFNDVLTYSIDIYNKSDIINDIHTKKVTTRGSEYSTFTVEEATSPYINIDTNSIAVIYDGVKYAGSNNVINMNGVTIKYSIKKKTANGKSKNVIIWEVPSLAVGKGIKLIYKGNVINKASYYDKTLLSTGIFYGGTETERNTQSGWNDENFITTGKVTNTIKKRNNLADDLDNKVIDLNSCYNSSVVDKTKQGLALVDEVYEKCLNLSINLSNNFSFDDLFVKINPLDNKYIQIEKKYQRETIDNVLLNDQSSYKPMILNNYWNSLITFAVGGVTNYLHFPRWNSFSTNERAKTVYNEDFKEGDILIYNVDWKSYDSAQHTKESGLYAYIFINGKFIGINYNGETNERNEFTYNYYQDKGLSLTTDFYTGYKSSLSQEFLTFLNFQTLFGKDDYVILRPIDNLYFAPSKPTITSDDGIESGKWHTKDVKLTFSGSKTFLGTDDVDYYWWRDGKDPVKSNILQTTSNNDGKTYYVKACNSDDTTLCSEIVSYTMYIDKNVPKVTLSSNENLTPKLEHQVTVTVIDTFSGLKSGASIEYGWSTSKTTAPSSYTSVSLSYTDAINTGVSIDVKGTGLAGKYYLWIKPNVKDIAGNTNDTVIVSNGQFHFQQAIAFPTCADKEYTSVSQTLFAAHTTGEFTNDILKGTNVGSYTVTLTPGANYQWSSGTDVTRARTLTCKIVKSDTTTNLGAITSIYNGNNQAAYGATSKLSNNTNISNAVFTYNYYTNSSCTSSITTIPINAGQYYVKATLTGTNNYNSSTSNCVSYKINKKKAIIGVESSLNLDDGNSKTISFTYDGDGTVGCISSDSSSVKCTVDNLNKKVILQALKTVNNNVYITLKATDSTNYSSPDDKSIVVTVSSGSKLIDILRNNNYLVSNSYVTGFILGNSINELINKIGNNITITSNLPIISTGAVIMKNNEKYTVVIKGDLNGDGKVNSADLLQMRKYLLGEVVLTGAYKQAGIIESKNDIKSLDLLRLCQYLLGEYVFK